jgi:predicted AlkP superfamily phosphohydrolase/phosphomutase
MECSRAARIALALRVVAVVVLPACGRSSTQSSKANGKRVVVLGIDGMDPGFLEQHWDSLPNLNRLRQDGGYTRLATTNPPQSPVAWSTLITGMNPAEHGIFDFVLRNPATLQPYSSLGQAQSGGWSLPLGPYRLPITHGHIRTFRSGIPFWQILGDRGIRSTILRMPENFPPAAGAGQSLSGMGTPDLRGTFGEFSFYTDDPARKAGKVPGGEVIRIALDRGHVRLPLRGPANPLRKDGASTFIEIPAAVDPSEPAARFDAAGQQLVLRRGEWPRWIRVRFPLIRWLGSAAGMFRIYLKEVHPRFEVYISPINIDPRSPELPVASPAGYSRELARAIGPFYTQGIAQDTAAYRQHIFSQAEYLEQSRQVSRELAGVLGYGLDHFHHGILFFHYFGIDQNSHMLWGKYDAELLESYQNVDNLIGRVRAQTGEATFIVMSDHGFTRFDRSVNLNTWLMREGLLTLNSPDSVGSDELFAHVDWSRTKAYSIGLNAIYVNQLDRERYGIVAPGEETAGVIETIRKRLSDFRDPQNGQPVAYSAVRPGDQDTKVVSESAPDLIVGIYPGYRSSWETALGAVHAEVVTDNTDEMARRPLCRAGVRSRCSSGQSQDRPRRASPV